MHGLSAGAVQLVVRCLAQPAVFYREPEWDAVLRGYLDAHTELSGDPSLSRRLEVAWLGPVGLAQFSQQSGGADREGVFSAFAVRGKEVPRMTRLMRFGTHCLAH